MFLPVPINDLNDFEKQNCDDFIYVKCSENIMLCFGSDIWAFPESETIMTKPQAVSCKCIPPGHGTILTPLVLNNFQNVRSHFLLLLLQQLHGDKTWWEKGALLQSLL